MNSTTSTNCCSPKVDHDLVNHILKFSSSVLQTADFGSLLIKATDTISLPRIIFLNEDDWRKKWEVHDTECPS